MNSTSISGIEGDDRQTAGHYGQAALAIKPCFSLLLQFVQLQHYLRTFGVDLMAFFPVYR